MIHDIYLAACNRRLNDGRNACRGAVTACFSMTWRPVPTPEHHQHPPKSLNPSRSPQRTPPAAGRCARRRCPTATWRTRAIRAAAAAPRLHNEAQRLSIRFHRVAGGTDPHRCLRCQAAISRHMARIVACLEGQVTWEGRMLLSTMFGCFSEIPNRKLEVWCSPHPRRRRPRHAGRSGRCRLTECHLQVVN